MKIVAICGSLRKQSVNRHLLTILSQKIGARAQFEVAEIHDIPLYSSDTETAGIPAAVAELNQKLASADAIVIATPEYNYSVPGGLKNALDWISRLPEKSMMSKPTAILGASPSALGTARAQYHLRQILVYFDAHVLNKPEVMVSAAHTKFDAQGNLTDEATSKVLGDFADAFLTFAKK